jgi:nucleotidyltransferase/DNA polymerase involved in DNA repair
LNIKLSFDIHGVARRPNAGLSLMKRVAPNPAERGLAEAFAPSEVACVWLPRFPVWAERARRPWLNGQPVALIGREAGGGEAGVVRACSAELAELAPGFPAHAVSQRCPGAQVLPFDEHHYRKRYEELLLALDALTPVIEPQPLEVFYLDLPRPPGPEAEGERREVGGLRELIPEPFPIRVGLAPGKFTAWVAAHYATAVRPVRVTEAELEVFLRDAPTHLLPVSPETARRLDLLGLRTLGRLRRVPRSALLAQFGWEGERAHRLACGEDREPLVPHAPPPVLRETLEFPMPAPTTAHFDLALHELLRRACDRSERRGRGIRQVRLEAQMEEGCRWERVLTLRRPHEDWQCIFAEVRRRLESVRPIGALTALTVELTAFAARVEAQPLLFPDEQQHRRDRLAYELAQLRERRGGSCVFRIVEVEPWSRLPEKRHALVNSDT